MWSGLGLVQIHALLLDTGQGYVTVLDLGMKTGNEDLCFKAACGWRGHAGSGSLLGSRG